MQACQAARAITLSLFLTLEHPVKGVVIATAARDINMLERKKEDERGKEDKIDVHVARFEEEK